MHILLDSHVILGLGSGAPQCQTFKTPGLTQLPSSYSWRVQCCLKRDPRQHQQKYKQSKQSVCISLVCLSAASGSDLRHGPVHPRQIHGDGDLPRFPGLSLQHRGAQDQQQPHERQRKSPLKWFGSSRPAPTPAGKCARLLSEL